MTKLKRAISLLIIIIMLAPPQTTARALYEGGHELDGMPTSFSTSLYWILSDPISGDFEGRPETFATRFNLMFTDMDGHFWALEAATRMGALDLIKGNQGSLFRPAELTTRAEAISHVMRVLGHEMQAISRLQSIQQQLFEIPEGFDLPVRNHDDLLLLTELAYLEIASELGDVGTVEDMDFFIITDQCFTDAMWEFRGHLPQPRDPWDREPSGFRAFDPVTREELAAYIFMSLLDVSTELWVNPGQTVQRVYMYGDWNNIRPWFLIPVESMLANGIMSGYLGNFLPREPVPRAVLAVVLRNMTDLFLQLQGLELRRGVVFGAIDADFPMLGEYTAMREVVVRRDDNTRDALRFFGAVDYLGNVQTLDAIVFRNFEPLGLQALFTGDAIEYIVNPMTGQVLYVQVLGAAAFTEVDGIIVFVDPWTREVEILGSIHSYFLPDHLIDIHPAGDFSLRVHGLSGSADGDWIHWDYIGGSIVRLSLFGSTISRITFLGEPIDMAQGSGIVIENNPAFGYMTILERSGFVVTKRYFQNDMVVQRREHFETGGPGYIAQMFPYFGFNPLITTIDQIEAGDLVFFRTDPDYPDVIISISASVDYSVRHANVISITPREGYMDVLVRFENHATSLFSIANGIRVTNNGRPSSIHHMVVGDWVRLLVNEAVIAPGIWTETVKEIMIEGPERHVNSFIRGSLSGLNHLQWDLFLEDAFELSQYQGWINHRDIGSFSLSSREIEFFHNDRQISRDEAARFARNRDITVYMALEAAYTGQRIRKVTFRDSRDTALAPDTVIMAPGSGFFEMLSQPGGIHTDDGTIVVRNGRLVSGRDIHAGDFVSVVLNGEGRAAIVNIVGHPGVNQLMFARARVMAVPEQHAGRSFQVASQSVLFNTTWEFTPVQRIYEIDHRTVFRGPAFAPGFTFEDFIGYTENTQVDRVFTIVAEGARAAYVIDQPFANGAIRGTIFAITPEGLMLREPQYREPLTGTWLPIPPADNALVTRNPGTNTWRPFMSEHGTLGVFVPPYALVAAENSVINLTDLHIGQQVLIMTNEIQPHSAVAPESITELDGGELAAVIDGLIIRAEN